MSRTRKTTHDEADGDDVGLALGVLLRSYREVVTPALSGFPHGARGYETMREVLRGERPSQLALANRLGLDRTVMTYLIDDLVAAGFVERRVNPQDRRQRQIVATARGRAAVSDLCEQVAAAERIVLAGLDPAEQELFRRLLGKAAAARGDHSFETCLTVIGEQ
ncbi:transcriptional regulator, MarR family [Lentzea xinjiangensis]|uniref:Transcriptional regulator, MarR family n=1 Tax=Lentzea xinjiangensis TaxID=402600 RepID=A0A1H9SV91_9PSEU|nr:MarR family winged helix-turn-helix transcriptional regulator [Lentzea xinjiangensis]SER88821.1 transcriptional regulator, MarR family [Lentzea xinjiangensis]